MLCSEGVARRSWLPRGSPRISELASARLSTYLKRLSARLSSSPGPTVLAYSRDSTSYGAVFSATYLPWRGDDNASTDAVTQFTAGDV